MSYEEDYREPFSSPCACGKGTLRYYRIFESNDWGQQRESSTTVEILCDYCKEHYHYEHTLFGDGLLVPNGLPLPTPVPVLANKYQYSSDEKFIGKHDKTVLEEMISDMTAPKHRFIKDLIYGPAIEYAQEWVLCYNKKSLPPMVANLRRILSQYDELLATREKKKPRVDDNKKRTEEYWKAMMEVEQKSFHPAFKYDSNQDMLDRERARIEQEEYKEAHKFDPFDARVTYHDSCRADSTGLYWDTLHIIECVDPQHLILDKPEYGPASITIVKRYKCKCNICGKEIIADSSGFRILFDEEKGFYPLLQCDCHRVSSFEAKVMDILNNRGISYAREVSFDELVGDYCHPLRFDFALFDCNSHGKEDKSAIRLLIELQGPHHYKRGEYDAYGEFVEDKDNSSPSAEARTEKQLHYDELKQEYCAEHGLALELIKYTSSGYEKLEELIAGILVKYGFDCNSNDLPF